MTDKPLITHERLTKVLNYCAETGVFTWAIKLPRNRMNPGDVAGTRNSLGYWQIVVDGRLYMAHRLAWLYVTGKWPCDKIDHANGRQWDNRFSNLREATASQNAANKRKPSNNTSGHKGIYLEPTGRYRVRIRVNDDLIHVGMFSTPEDAACAYAEAAKMFFGEYANAG